jgi:hypothetical protein
MPELKSKDLRLSKASQRAIRDAIYEATGLKPQRIMFRIEMSYVPTDIILDLGGECPV